MRLILISFSVIFFNLIDAQVSDTSSVDFSIIDVCDGLPINKANVEVVYSDSTVEYFYTNDLGVVTVKSNWLNVAYLKFNATTNDENSFYFSKKILAENIDSLPKSVVLHKVTLYESYSDLEFYFKGNRARLVKYSKFKLDLLGELMTETCPFDSTQVSFTIYNNSLNNGEICKKRGQNIFDYLVENYQIHYSRVNMYCKEVSNDLKQENKQLNKTITSINYR